MTEHDDDDTDRLEAAPPPRRSATAAAVAVSLVVVGALVLLGVASRDPQRTPEPVGSTSPPAAALPSPAVHHSRPPVMGSVFLEHLGRCTRTDDRRHVTVAVRVTNLEHGALLLIGAVPLRSDAGVKFTGSRIGRLPCADSGSAAAVRLAPSRAAVVALSFVVSPQCLHDPIVSARVSVDIGHHHVVHADSSQLASLTDLGYTTCPA